MSRAQAVLATVGPMAEKQAKNLEVMATAAGSTGEASRKRRTPCRRRWRTSAIKSPRSPVLPRRTPQYCQSVTNSLGGALQVGIAGPPPPLTM